MTSATTIATTLRAFDHAGDSFEANSTHRLETGLFREWSAPGVDLVRKATDAEAAKFTGASTSTRAPAPKRTRRSRKPAAQSAPAATPAPAPAPSGAPDTASEEA